MVITGRADVVVQRVSDSAVLLDLASGEYFTLNEVSARVWELCDGTRTVEDVAGVIAEEYDVGTGTAEKDVRGLVGELSSCGLLA